MFVAIMCKRRMEEKKKKQQRHSPVRGTGSSQNT